MTTFTDLDRALRQRGWHYDATNEEFRDGNKRLDYRDVQKLVPGMTLDELASYQDDTRCLVAAHRHHEPQDIPEHQGHRSKQG
jgi:hypothetical protein